MNLAKLFQRQRPPAARPEPRAIRAVEPVPAGSPFDHLAILLGVAAPAEVTLDPNQNDAVDALCEQVRAAFGHEPPVPSASQRVALQVIAEIARPDGSQAEVTRWVQQDPALTAAVLKVANSAAYAQAGQQSHTLKAAVTRLGAAEVGRVAGLAAARSLYVSRAKNEQASFRRELAECFEDARITALVASRFALTVPGARADEVYLMGMLHDLGRALALGCLVSLMKAKGSLPKWLVDATVDRVHGAMGAVTLANWRLPEFLSLAAAHHHLIEIPEGPARLHVHIVRLVSALVQARRTDGVLDARWRAEIESSARVLAIDGFALRALDTQIREARRSG